MISCFHFFLIVALLQLQSCTNANDYCQVVVESVEYVPSCPTSKIQWDNAASKKKCWEKARQQNCTTKKYEYHCVINEYANATLEVCASRRVIFGNTFTAGHCTEFNTGGRVIQDHCNGLARCNDIFPRCDQQYYFSTDAYKCNIHETCLELYQDCYQLVKRSEITSSIPASFKTSRGPDSRDVIIIALTVVCSILIAFVIVIAVQNIYKSRRRSRNHTNNPEEVHQDTFFRQNTDESGDDCEENDIVLLSPNVQQINYGSAL